MDRSRAHTFVVITLGGLATTLVFCALASFVFVFVARALEDPSPFETYSDVLFLSLVFAGPCAFPLWAALVHLSLVEPRALRNPFARGAFHGLASVFVPSLLMFLLDHGARLSMGLLVTGASVGAVVALMYARLARWSGLVVDDARHV
jgi:hypothetical protein